MYSNTLSKSEISNISLQKKEERPEFSPSPSNKGKVRRQTSVSQKETLPKPEPYQNLDLGLPSL